MSLKSPREDFVTAELMQITRIHLAPVKGSSHATKPVSDDCFLTHPVLHCIASVSENKKKEKEKKDKKKKRTCVQTEPL